MVHEWGAYAVAYMVTSEIPHVMLSAFGSPVNNTEGWCVLLASAQNIVTSEVPAPLRYVFVGISKVPAR